MAEPPYRRVVLKISGESLCSPGGSGIDPAAMGAVTEEIASVAKGAAQLGLVVGAGNFIRGRDLAAATCVRRATADSMGMLATLVNGLALRDALADAGIETRVMSAIPAGTICETFSRDRAVEHLSAGRVVLFAGGTGSPFFTTDMAAALRACEIGAQIVLKATKVDGVYDSDPMSNPAARKYDRLTYGQVLADRLGVMDLAAVGMCMDNHVPVLVFQFSKPGNLARAMGGQDVGTLITD